MSVPAQTQILDILGARFGNITLANGYFNTVEKIDRARLKPFKNTDMPAINYYMTSDSIIEAQNLGFTDRNMTVVIEFYTVTRDQNFLTLANKMAADIQIAIERTAANPAVSDSVSNRLGKKVVKVELDTITPAIGEGQAPYCGVVISLSINYRINKNDPFTLIDY